MKATVLFVIMLAAALIMLTAGCTLQQASQPAPVTQATQVTTAPTPQLPDTVMVNNSAFGQILVDEQGKTLYFNVNDAQNSGTSSCTGDCSAIWPVFYTDSIRVSLPLSPGNFATITRPDGTKQTTYMGRPLYYSTYDTKPGDLNGQGIDMIWNVADVAGTVVTTPPTTVPTTEQTPNLARGSYLNTGTGAGSSGSSGGGGGY